MHVEEKRNSRKQTKEKEDEIGFVTGLDDSDHSFSIQESRFFSFFLYPVMTWSRRGTWFFFSLFCFLLSPTL